MCGGGGVGVDERGWMGGGEGDGEVGVGVGLGCGVGFVLWDCFVTREWYLG